MHQVSCFICGAHEGRLLFMLKPDAHRRLCAATSAEPVRFVVCEGCGFIYQTPRFTLDELRSIYAEEYRKNTLDSEGVPKAQYLEFAKNKSRREFDWIQERLPVSHGGDKRVLEIGCATGQLLRFFKDYGWQALGVEPTHSFAEYGTRIHKVPILQELFENVDLSTEAGFRPAFDLVILSQVLEHVEEPSKVLTRVASFLRSNGRIYVSVPYYLTYLPVRPARELFISTHFHIFSPVSLGNLASHCGLAVESVGTMSRYLCAILRPDMSISPCVERENPFAIRVLVRRITLRYAVLHDSRFLLAEWVKGRLRAGLGEGHGERAIDILRQLKHRVFGI